MDLSSDALAVGWAPLFPNEEGMTLPIRQMAPEQIHYNLLADPAMADLFMNMVVSKEPVQSGLAPIEFLQLPRVPHTLMMQPIFAVGTKYRVITGVTFNVLSWHSLFHDILPPNSGKMVLVLEDTCDDAQLTYELDGPNTTFLGYFDQHDDSYTNMEKTIWLDPLSHADSNESAKTCKYHLHIFPSQELEEDQQSMLPVIYAVVVAGAVGLFLIAFICYDRFVEARQERVLARAARSNAIVASLFPSNVRDRILKDAEEQVEQKQRRKSGTAAKAQLKSFLIDGGGITIRRWRNRQRE